MKKDFFLWCWLSYNFSALLFIIFSFYACNFVFWLKQNWTNLFAECRVRSLYFCWYLRKKFRLIGLRKCVRKYYLGTSYCVYISLTFCISLMTKSPVKLSFFKSVYRRSVWKLKICSRSLPVMISLIKRFC